MAINATSTDSLKLRCVSDHTTEFVDLNIAQKYLF